MFILCIRNKHTLKSLIHIPTGIKEKSCTNVSAFDLESALLKPELNGAVHMSHISIK